MDADRTPKDLEFKTNAVLHNTEAYLAMSQTQTSVCFPGTEIPQRVVITYKDTYKALSGELKATTSSWLDPALPSLVIEYFDDASARETLVKLFGEPGAPIIHETLDVVAAWDALLPGAYKADVFRYAYLWWNGGVYVDVKLTRQAPYELWMGRSGTVVIDQMDYGMWNAIFAAPPRAPWLLEALQLALGNVKAQFYGANPLDTTGPGCFGRAFKAWILCVRADNRLEASCRWWQKNPARLVTRGLRVLELSLANSGVVELGHGALTNEQLALVGKVLVKNEAPLYRASQTQILPVKEYLYAWTTRNAFVKM